MWQLKKLSTNEALNEAQSLPENWGPVFGLAGVQDRLADLSWLGPDYVDQGWFEVGEAPPVDKAKQVRQDIENFLNECAHIVAVDNISITKGSMAEWLEYRRLLREVPLQAGFPDEIVWPAKPSE